MKNYTTKFWLQREPNIIEEKPSKKIKDKKPKKGKGCPNCP